MTYTTGMPAACDAPGPESEHADGAMEQDGVDERIKRKPKVHKPYFSPSLALQRRAFVLEVLKKEGIRSAAELGCGEGSVLSVLCQPAPHIDDFPPSVLPPPDQDNPRTIAAHEKLQQLTHKASQSEKQLHLRRLAGLDIRPDLLDLAAKATAPVSRPLVSSANGDSEGPAEGIGANLSTRQPLRWEPLLVELWQGSLDVYNENLDGYECFIATEVVEHLPNPVLSNFGTVVLGRYSPRIAIVTTPNYDFAPYFPKVSPTSDEDQRVFKDPTGRTDRVFRDADHKFEWTAAEFKEWCARLAKEHDYEYSISGVGGLKHYLHHYDTALPDIYATQCAVFKKIYDSLPDERNSRSPIAAPLAFYQPSPPKGTYAALPPKMPHALRHSHKFEAVTNAGKTGSLRRIRQVIKDEMVYTNVAEMTLASLWLKMDVQVACGGYIGKVLEAVIFGESDEWDFDVTPNKLDVSSANAVIIHNRHLWRNRDERQPSPKEIDEALRRMQQTSLSSIETQATTNERPSIWEAARGSTSPPGADDHDASWIT